MIVVDASALVEVLVGNASDEHLRAFAAGPVVAPGILDVEVISALRRLVRHEGLAPAVVERALDDLDALPIVRHASRVLVRRAWELRGNLTIYDGVYVALAEQVGARLMTVDRRLASSARDLGVVTL